jgi:hypothetical protein
MSNATKVENTRNICAGAAFAIERGNGPVTTTYATTDDGWTVSADIATEAVYGSAVNENHEKFFHEIWVELYAWRKEGNPSKPAKDQPFQDR